MERKPKQYGIKFVYVGGKKSTERFWHLESERDATYNLIAQSDWTKIWAFCDTLINLQNVAYCECIER